jgi:PPOX class probable F420-dependent enzyme
MAAVRALEGFESLLQGAAPATLTTYRRSGEALTTPVWFRVDGEAFEVVIALGDVKLDHLRRDPRALLVIFEAAPPFRGVEARGLAELVEGDVHGARAEIASRYLGPERGRRFADARRERPGVRMRLVPERLRTWDVRGMLGA